ncbi:MAG: DUF4440 domain-containing protein [Acidimicrobiia bacterium]|nr:DUF4440 domain-containing protein [Acidimicrobiia bacterium]
MQDLLDRWAEAIIANDADGIAAFAEPDWELVTPESGPVPLAGFLDAVRSGHLTHSSMSFDVRSVRRLGDVAAVLARGNNTGTWMGKPFHADEWMTEVFVVAPGRRWGQHHHVPHPEHQSSARQPADRGLPTATPVGGMQALLPGASQLLQLALEPGRYAVICAVPSPDGTPHHDRGMVQEVTDT